MSSRTTYRRDDGVTMIEIAPGRFVQLYAAYERGLISEAEYKAAQKLREVVR